MDPTPFHDLELYVALPRVSGLLLSPDGRRLVTGVQTLDDDGSTYVRTLWGSTPPATDPPGR